MPRVSKIKEDQPFPNDGLVNAPSSAKFLEISKSNFWKLVKENKLPKPIKISSRTTRWRAKDIRAVIE